MEGRGSFFVERKAQMKKTRRVEILFTDSEYRKMLSAKGNNSVSDYIRSLIMKNCDHDKREANDFADLLQKLRLADFEKIHQRMQKVEHALQDLLALGSESQVSTAAHPNKVVSTDNLIRTIATILAVNARAIPGESKVFGELIGEDFLVKQPFDFIFAYLRFFSEQRPYAVTHLKRLFPDLFKAGGQSERGN
jgi:predicted CopG family antitoxin